VDAPALRCLIYRYGPFGLLFDVVTLAHWVDARSEYLLAGWRFIGVDPCDEDDLARYERMARIQQ
jgi:hypothetical protein